MGSVPFALSVHKFISSVGADAGFAALIAVAILVLLYFAHARENAGLRARIQELLERISELETAVARVAANQARVMPAPPPAGLRTPAGAQAPAAAQAGARGRAPAPAPASAGSRLAALELPPSAPAGLGAPALSSATRVIPAAVAARIAAARVAVAAGGGGGEPPREPAGNSTALAPVPPSTAAGGNVGSNGSSARTPAPVGAGVVAAPATTQSAAAGAPPRQPAPRPASAGNGGPDRPASAAAARRPASRPSSVSIQGGPGRRVHFPRPFLIGLAVLIVAAVVVAAVVLSQSNSPSHASKSSASTGTSTKTATQRRRTANVVAVNPANVTVAILNGTTIAHLAHKVAAKLVPPYREGTVGDATDQTHTTTTVSYLPGHRAAALAVARALGLGAGVVQPVDPGTQNVACAGATPCTTDVVVTVGSDLASL